MWKYIHGSNKSNLYSYIHKKRAEKNLVTVDISSQPFANNMRSEVGSLKTRRL